MNNGIVVHPTGNQNSREVVRGLVSSGFDVEFVTAISTGFLDNIELMPGKIKSEISRRSFSDLNVNVRSGAFLLEAFRLLLKNKIKISVDSVYVKTDKYCAEIIRKKSNNINFIYAYEDGALESFQEAKKHGIKCIYELPIGYWEAHRKTNKVEFETNPLWGRTWKAINDSEDKLNRKKRELLLADEIIVASSFTKKTIKESFGCFLDTKIHVIPYGFPSKNINERTEFYNQNNELKILYVGGLNQRKGISYLVEAYIELLKKNLNINLSYIGSGECIDMMKNLMPSAKYLGTMPHSQVLKEMSKHDVLIFPSLFEGFGMVLSEAMSCGMVVISTERTALPDISDENSAIIINACSSDDIFNAVDRLLKNPSLAEYYGRNAQNVARNYTWENYGKKISHVVKKSISHDL